MGLGSFLRQVNERRSSSKSISKWIRHAWRSKIVENHHLKLPMNKLSAIVDDPIDLRD